MVLGIQPEILATFEGILPEHGDLEEYLQAMVTQNRSSAAQHETFEEADMDFHRALILSFMEAQNVHDASPSTSVRGAETELYNRSENLSLDNTRNNSLDLEFDAAIALSLEEVEQAAEEEEEAEEVAELIDSLISAEDDRGVILIEASVSVTAQDDIDPDDMTFEQLQMLEEAVGSENRGLSKELFDSFPVQKLMAKSGWFSSRKRDPEGCPICVTEYEVGSKLLTLPCLHLYHKSCIKEWLKDNKTCPICNTDLSLPQA